MWADLFVKFHVYWLFYAAMVISLLTWMMTMVGIYHYLMARRPAYKPVRRI
jgi:hypothetical protein